MRTGVLKDCHVCSFTLAFTMSTKAKVTKPLSPHMSPSSFPSITFSPSSYSAGVQAAGLQHPPCTEGKVTKPLSPPISTSTCASSPLPHSPPPPPPPYHTYHTIQVYSAVSLHPPPSLQKPRISSSPAPSITPSPPPEQDQATRSEQNRTEYCINV